MIVNPQIPTKNSSIKYTQFTRAQGLCAAPFIVAEAAAGDRSLEMFELIRWSPFNRCGLPCGALIKKYIDVFASCLLGFFYISFVILLLAPSNLHRSLQQATERSILRRVSNAVSRSSCVAPSRGTFMKPACTSCIDRLRDESCAKLR